MPANKITSSNRSEAAIAGSILLAASGVGGGYQTTKPPAGVNHMIKPWEGLVIKSRWDSFEKTYYIFYGETGINGKPVTASLSFTADQCEDMLIIPLLRDEYTPLTKQIAAAPPPLFPSKRLRSAAPTTSASVAWSVLALPALPRRGSTARLRGSDGMEPGRRAGGHRSRPSARDG